MYTQKSTLEKNKHLNLPRTPTGVGELFNVGLATRQTLSTPPLWCSAKILTSKNVKTTRKLNHAYVSREKTRRTASFSPIRQTAPINAPQELRVCRSGDGTREGPCDATCTDGRQCVVLDEIKAKEVKPEASKPATNNQQPPCGEKYYWAMTKNWKRITQQRILVTYCYYVCPPRSAVFLKLTAQPLLRDAERDTE